MESPTSVIKVLIVEDSEDDALLMMRSLRRAGYQLDWRRVQTAEALEDALETAHWDIIISDYQLPGFDAPAALAIVKECGVDIPFIVLSGTIADADAVALMRAGAHDYLMKDNLARLPEAVRREIREAQVRRDRHSALAELQVMKDRLELTVEGAEIGIWDWYIPTGMVTINDRCAHLVGFTLAEFVPAHIDTWQRHIHRQDIATRQAAIAQHFQGTLVPYECEFRVHDRQGDWRWILDRGRVVERDETGQPMRMVGTSLDITARKRTELRLQLQQTVLEQIAQARSLETTLETLVHGLELQLDQCLAGVVMLPDSTRRALRIAAAPNLPAAYCAAIEGQPIAADSGLCGMASYQQQIVIVSDIIANPLCQSCQAAAIATGVRAGWCVPVVSRGGDVLANLAIYYDHPHQPHSHEIDTVRLAANMANIAIERTRETETLAQLNRELEQRVVQRTAALRASESRLQRLARNVPGALYQYVKYPDGSGEFTYLSDRWQAMFQVDLQQAHQDAAAVFAQIFPSDRAAFARCIAESAQHLQPFSWEGRVLVERETPCWVQAIAQPEQQPNGDIVWDGLVLDISTRKQIEAKLQTTIAELARATRLKDEFLANMSHELRTPLNAILGMSEGLDDQVFGCLNEHQQKAIATIAQSGHHLLDLINDILDLSKIEAGKFELKPTDVFIQDLCDTSLTFVKQLAFNKQIKLSISIAPELRQASFQADDRRLRQVLINLLSNAVKFTPEAGSVMLQVKLQPGSPTHLIEFSVADTGIGIPADRIDTIFQPFTQIDSRLNRQYNGTGLGLALVQQITHLHGGHIQVRSVVGQGSTFSVTLPYITCDALPPSLAVPYSDRGTLTTLMEDNSPLILLAEDNAANIATISSYLKAKGYQLIVANDGKTTVQLANRHRPDIILMDIQMPIMDGLEAIQILRQQPEQATLPIIALTALAMPGDRDRCLAAGASDYLAKPIKLRKLMGMIQQYLTR